MKKLLTILALSSAIFANETLCYKAENDVNSNLWETIAENKVLVEWLKTTTSNKQDDCITLTSDDAIKEAKEIVEQNPTNTFYIKEGN